MKVLVFSTLYPNDEQLHHGIFIERRVLELQKRTGWAFEIVAPVPWFPLSGERWGGYGRFARVPERDERHGIPIHHPRYLVVPGLSWRIAPLFLYLATLGLMRKLRDMGSGYDLIDAHFAFPDGVAAVMLARRLGVPVAVSARGSDINDSPRSFLPRLQLRAALRKADALIAVSQSLADGMRRLIAPNPAQVVVLPNGVDREVFRPLDRAASRSRFELSGKVVLSVGNLRPLKGHHLLIEALAGIADAVLVIAGGGGHRQELQACADRHGVADRVRFLGVVAPDELPYLYSAADVFALASSSEGCPNVILEAMACGVPVVATRVGAIPELVPQEGHRLLVSERSALALRQALVAALQDAPPSRVYTDRAESLGWSSVCERLAAKLGRLAEHRQS